MKGREALKWLLIRNEQGMLFPVAVILLFYITGGITIYLYGYQAQINSYNSLESSNVRATIAIINEINDIQS